MKSISCSFCALILALALLLSGCSPVVDEAARPLTIYTTFYPIHVIASKITDGAQNLQLNCLVAPQDGCLRSYELSDWDLYLLSYASDIILSGGRGMESFDSSLQTLSENGIPLVHCLYGLELLSGKSQETDESSHFSNENPHLYMSIDGAMKIAENISDALLVLDESNSALYKSNLNAAVSELRALKDEISTQTSVCIGQKAAVMNEALLYPAAEYQLEVAAIIERESGTDLYEEQLTACINTLNESGARVVLIEQQAPKTLTDALTHAGFIVVRMDILSTKRTTDGFEDYINTLKNNAKAVATAFAQ